VTIRFGRERGARQSPVQFGLSLASAWLTAHIA